MTEDRGRIVNIESVPSEAGPDLDGIEQGISNYEVEIASFAIGGLAMTPHPITANAYLVRGKQGMTVAEPSPSCA